MNKKLIIGLIVAGVVVVVVGGGVYLYNKNKKNQESKKNFASESDAIELADLIGKKDEPLSEDKTKNFIELYKANIDKDLHKRLVSVLNKKESSWTSKDKLDTSVLDSKVLKPLLGW